MNFYYEKGKLFTIHTYLFIKFMGEAALTYEGTKANPKSCETLAKQVPLRLKSSLVSIPDSIKETIKACCGIAQTTSRVLTTP